MKEQFIPYEQAVELKELGFDEKCFGFYSGKLENLLRLYEDVLENFHFEKGNTPAPLWQQAFEFISKKYNCFGNIISVCSDKTSAFYFDIKMQGFYGSILDSVWFSSYEETRLECLKKLIEIVKEQK